MITRKYLLCTLSFYIFTLYAGDSRSLKHLFTKEEYFSMSAPAREIVKKHVHREICEQEWQFLMEHMPSEKQLPILCCASCGGIAAATAAYGCTTGLAAGCLLYTCIFGTASCCAIRHGQKVMAHENAIIKEWQKKEEKKRIDN